MVKNTEFYKKQDQETKQTSPRQKQWYATKGYQTHKKEKKNFFFIQVQNPPFITIFLYLMTVSLALQITNILRKTDSFYFHRIYELDKNFVVK